MFAAGMICFSKPTKQYPYNQVITQAPISHVSLDVQFSCQNQDNVAT